MTGVHPSLRSNRHGVAAHHIIDKRTSNGNLEILSEEVSKEGDDRVLGRSEAHPLLHSPSEKRYKHQESLAWMLPALHRDNSEDGSSLLASGLENPNGPIKNPNAKNVRIALN